MIIASAVGLSLLIALLNFSADPFYQSLFAPLTGASLTTSIKDNVIALENTHAGTRAWQLRKKATTQIQAYASATSISPGQALTFYVSTQVRNTPYQIDIYRLGWYGGLGGRLMRQQTEQIGQAQGYYDPNTRILVHCDSCYVDKSTGLVEANWNPSYEFTVPSDWVTGIYLAKFTDIRGFETYAVFDVRGNTHSLYVAVTPDATNNAYNSWGGYSLYVAYNTVANGSQSVIDRLHHGVNVSFDRPDFYNTAGTSQVLLWEANAVHWFERQGYDISYMSDIDVQAEPMQLLQHRAYISLGHDEYWTKEMRDAVEQARDKGVGLAFLGGNDVYWQIRLAPDRAGIPNRLETGYKVTTEAHNLALDPLYGKDNSRVTTHWRDALLARPENALLGIMSSGLTQQQLGFPWKVNPQAHSSLLDNTGLESGQSYGCDIVGNEWGRIFDNGATPAGLQVLGQSPTIDSDTHTSDISQTTYYIAPSGVMVFAAGAIRWSLALDSYRFLPDKLCAPQEAEVPGIQKLMAHIMDALIVHHASGQSV